MRRTRDNRGAGFSIIEILFALALVALVVVLGVVTLSKSRTTADSRAIAATIAEEMRLTRQRAISKHTFTAVVFPNANGARATCQSYYVLEGDANPKVLRVADFSQQAPNISIFNGVWDLDPSKLSDPTKLTTVEQPSTGTVYDQFDPTQWKPSVTGGWGGSESDFAYIFTPAGTVRTNGLPSFDASFHVVVAQAVAYAPAPTPPSAYEDSGFVQCFIDLGSAGFSFQSLTNAVEPFTIGLTPGGNVTVSEGVTGASSVRSSAAAGSNAGGGAVPAPAPTVPARAANHDPNIQKVTLLPRPNPSTQPANVDATVRPGGVQSLQLQCTDPDGDPLCVTWSADGGVFSRTGETAMEWSHSERIWGSTNQWSPPSGAAAGNVYTLTCTVSDQQGGRTTITRRVQILGKGRIWFLNATSAGREVVVMNEDGTGLAHVLDGVAPGETGSSAMYNGPRHYSISPDGTLLAYRRYGDPDLTGQGATLAHGDGTGKRALPYSYIGDPRWSPSGATILWTGGASVGVVREGTFTMNGDGTGTRWLPVDRWLSYGASPWSPDGTRLVACRNQWAQNSDFLQYGWGGSLYKDGNAIFVMNADGSQITTVLSYEASSMIYSPSWSPDGSKIVFYRWVSPVVPNYSSVWSLAGVVSSYSNDSRNGIYAMNPDGSNVQQVFSFGGTYRCGSYGSWLKSVTAYPTWSSDSRQIYFSASQGDAPTRIYRVNVDGTGLVQLTSDLPLPFKQGGQHQAPIFTQ